MLKLYIKKRKDKYYGKSSNKRFNGNSYAKHKDMVDVNTIIGDPVQTPDGFVILPISKVSFGLAAGGGEYYGDIDFSESTKGNSPLDDKLITLSYPFAGGSGAGVCITPVAFMVVGGGDVQLLPVASNTLQNSLLK